MTEPNTHIIDRLTPCHSNHRAVRFHIILYRALVCRMCSHGHPLSQSGHSALGQRKPADIQSDFEHHPSCVINMRRACAAVSVVLCSEMGTVMGVVMVVSSLR